MTAEQIQHEKTIFHAARVITLAEQRSAYLAQACGEDHALRERIEALLKVYETEPSREGDDVPAGSALFEKFAPSVDESPGTIMGRYKLLERIGEGGFGVVYLAEQQFPIRRKVALKVIKAGLDTKQVIARFEAERQALAIMDHENIAKVLDAGANEAGRPYFVMELVRGVPITEFCDQNRLSPRKRLKLFVKVCRAVQHAHTKGIIHRDIKPTNVLVTLHDGVAVPKVIDFGVAKATGQQLLTDQTLFTQFAQMVGTPLYMSPEQAEMSEMDVDTRSDVYSLGVLLYELLTGTTPFDKERLRRAAVDEVRRIIREEEPPRPSTRLSTVAGLASIAASRGLEPKKLGGIVKGELDWIVMRALEKERTRRYDTASGLARDVERFLNDESVEAGPPSATYRFRKFARRYKRALLTASALLIMLVAMLVGLAVSNRMIAAERNEKALALKEKEQALALAEAQTQRAQQNFWKAAITVRDIVTNVATGKLAVPPETRENFIVAAMRFYKGIIDENSADPSHRFETAIGHRSIALIHASLEKKEESVKAYRQAIAVLERLSADYPDNSEYEAELATTRVWLSRLLESAGKRAEAATERALAKEGYERSLKRAPDSFYVLSWTARLASMEAVDHARAGRMADFDKQFRRTIELADRAEKAPRDFIKYPKGVDYQRTSGHTYRVLAFDLRGLGLNGEAEQCYRHAIVIFDRAHEEEPKEAAHFRFGADTRRRLGEVLLVTNRLTEAEGVLRDAVVRYEAHPAEWSGSANPEGRSATHFALAVLLANTGREKEAAECMTRGLAIDPTDRKGWREAAGLCVASGDHPGYRRACKELLGRFPHEAAKDPEVATHTVRACVLARDAVDDFSRVEKLADRAVSGTDKHKSRRSFVLDKGLSSYRAGNYSDAMQWLQRYEPKPNGVHTDAVAFAALAISQERLGESREATASLAAAGKIVAGKPIGRYSADWLEWLHAEILSREAESVIIGKPSATRPSTLPE